MIGIYVGLLVLSCAAAYAYTEISDIRIGLHGYLALFLGIAGTLAVGIGLMSLVFYSSRHGYDDIDRDGR